MDKCKLQECAVLSLHQKNALADHSALAEQLWESGADRSFQAIDALSITDQSEDDLRIRALSTSMFVLPI